MPTLTQNPTDTVKEPIHIISLGAGVQSSTMALMAAHGEITPMPSFAVFADTQAEPKEVYQWLDWLEQQLPFPIRRTTAGSLTKATLKIARSKKSGRIYMNGLIPAFVEKPDGGRGLLGRRCTANHKIIPVHQEYRRILGVKSVRTTKPLITQWVGISYDEMHRMKEARQRWIVSIWPLIERKMRRADCLGWMKANGFPEPPRSACTYCPFHNDAEWHRIKMTSPVEFQEVVDFEKQLQSQFEKQEVMTGKPFLHSSCKPISEVEFNASSPDWVQENLFGLGQECEGLCGV